MLVEYAARRRVTLISSVIPARTWRKISSRRVSAEAGGSVIGRVAGQRRSCAMRTGVSPYDPLMPPSERVGPSSTPARRLGADIGGTFTDVAFVGSDGELSMH